MVSIFKRYRLAAWLPPLAIFWLNLWICWRLLFTEYLIHYGSIEPFFYALSRYIRSNWPHLGWFPYWYCGMPFDYTYQPLLHYLVAALGALMNFSDARAFHFVVAIVYSLGPVSVYALALRLSRNRAVAAVAGLLYSLWSPSALLAPAVALDLGGPWFPQRLHSAVAYGDGPEILGLTLLPVALLLMDRAFEKRTARALFAAAIGIISVLLTNIPATIALAMALMAFALAPPPPGVGFLAL